MPSVQGFETMHPLYEAMLPVYRRNADLYDGGQSVEGDRNAKTHKYLVRHNYEKDKQFEIRIRRAAYRNLAAPTVDLFASSIHDGVTRDGLENIERFAPLLTDCDRQGNTPDQFFRRVDTRAAAVGVEFVLVDMPTATVPAVNQAEARRQGLIPYFVRIPAPEIIAWDFDPDGSLAWAVRKNKRIVSAGPFAGYSEDDIITLWRKDGWTRYVSRDRAQYVLEAEGTYSLGLVPVVPFIYEPESPMTGRSVIDDVASLIIRIFNQDSELDKMLFDAALPLLAAFGLQTDEEEEALVKASNAIWRFSDNQGRLEYVEPSGASFAAKSAQIGADVESVREISLRQTRPRGAGVESAEAKRLDSVQISSQLASFARSCAAGEKLCWRIAAKMAGVDEASLDKLEIRYNETFDPEALADRLTETYLELRRNGDLSRATLLGQIGFSPEQIAEEQRLLEEEQRETAGPEGNLAGQIAGVLGGAAR